jgi:hypothetical protein
MFFSILAILIACETEIEEEQAQNQNSEGDDTTTLAGIHEEASDYSWNAGDVIPVILNGTTVTAGNKGISVNGSRITVISAGTYSFRGTLSDGQIIVNTSDKGVVRLILDGAGITCSDHAPVCIVKASKVILILAENTSNLLTDGKSYSSNQAAGDATAALFSSSDLTIYGKGTLSITGRYKDGIAGKDGLIISGGTLVITAADDGIRGKDYLVVKEGNISVTSGGDGMVSDNSDDASRGYVSLQAGTFAVTSGGDAIYAASEVLISGGGYTILTGGGSGKTTGLDLSAKGLKGESKVTVTNGTFQFNCVDDAVHSDNSIILKGGTMTISTGDDAIHADNTIELDGCDITILKSYEGIESENISIISGNISIVSSDDGINCAAGTTGTPSKPGMSTGKLTIENGTIWINSGGDGLDINGSIVMSGGTLLINGPTNNGDGAIDYDGTFGISGGWFLAAGSSGMAQTAGSTSQLNALLINFTSVQKAGSLFHLQTQEGKEVVTFEPLKNYQSVSYASPGLMKGTTYDVYLGGSYSTAAKDGLYTGGTYTGGTKYTSFTVSGVVTTIGSTGGGGPFRP